MKLKCLVKTSIYLHGPPHYSTSFSKGPWPLTNLRLILHNCLNTNYAKLGSTGSVEGVGGYEGVVLKHRWNNFVGKIFSENYFLLRRFEEVYYALRITEGGGGGGWFF